ncbi:hypothetical protein OG474_30605 [Kribbella sp. NBC_01505]|uniref:hypothetical protein n=1 Tax=Kribbella sp. NBC_01505 TaxID=2903580 RepID=UPI003865ED21
MKIANDGEAPQTMHLVLDDPDDQIYVTYQGLTISVSLGQPNPDDVFQPRPVELSLMPEDDLDLVRPPLVRHDGMRYIGPGDGLRVELKGKTVNRFDRHYRKDG